MLAFLYDNLATIMIALIVLGLVILAVRSLWKDKKQGKSCGGCSGCGGSCGSCHESGACHSDKI